MSILEDTDDMDFPAGNTGSGIPTPTHETPSLWLVFDGINDIELS